MSKLGPKVWSKVFSQIVAELALELVLTQAQGSFHCTTLPLRACMGK